MARKKRKRPGPKDITPVMPYPVRWGWWGPVHVPAGSWWAAGWTTEKLPYGPSQGKYAAFLFKFSMEDRTWSVSQVSYKAARWRAKDQSYKWHCKKAGKPFTSLHKKRPGPTAGNRLKWAVKRAAQEQPIEEDEILWVEIDE
jgi:hypothetical protein